MMKPITKGIVLALHKRTVERFGGADGIRDEGLLEAAFDGIEFYPTIEEKAARLCFEIITQHPFIDGNKRTGALLLGVFLRKNGIKFTPQANDYYKIIMDVASGVKGYEDILKFIRES